MACQIFEFVKAQKAATCDEVMVALGFPHGSASVRYSELVASGCFVPTKKRQTRSGGMALAHEVAEGVTFNRYLDFLTRPKGSKKGSVLLPLEQSVLQEGMLFIQKWRKARTPKQRENIAVDLVNKLAILAR
jgi:hypothetical protein